MSNKPLHVQVGEALGWVECRDRGDGLWQGHDPKNESLREIPRFDISFCATGPIISSMKIGLAPPISFRDEWVAYTDDNTEAAGDTALLAVCNLLVERKGQLKA